MTATSRALLLSRMRRALADGEAVRLREDAGLSTSESAAAVGVVESTYWRWEKQLRVPRGAAALRYAKFLDRLREVVLTQEAPRDTA